MSTVWFIADVTYDLYKYEVLRTEYEAKEYLVGDELENRYYIPFANTFATRREAEYQRIQLLVEKRNKLINWLSDIHDSTQTEIVNLYNKIKESDTYFRSGEDE